MTQISLELWDQTVALYEAADREAFAACLASDDEPVGSEAEKTADKRHDELRAVADRLEEQLLSHDAPTAAAARYQLKVFALRHFSIDLDEPPMENAAPADITFRRIYDGLLQ